MAKMMRVLLVDDLDGQELGEQGHTVEFGWLGQSYEIDLSDEHATAMKDALGMYVEHARRLDRGRNSARRRGRPAGGASSESKAARAWLIEHGHLSPDARGRISEANWERYRNRDRMSLEGSSSGDTATAESQQQMTTETPTRRSRGNSRKAEQASAGTETPESVPA